MVVWLNRMSAYSPTPLSVDAKSAATHTSARAVMLMKLKLADFVRSAQRAAWDLASTPHESSLARARYFSRRGGNVVRRSRRKMHSASLDRLRSATMFGL